MSGGEVSDEMEKIDVENKRKRLEVFIEEKGKEDKADEDVPNIKKGRSTSTSIKSTPVVKKEKIKMVLIEKDLKKKGKLIVEDSKITKNDSRKKVKIVVTKDQDEELIDEEEREDLNSKFFCALKIFEYGKNTDIWVDNGKSIVPFDDSYLLNSDSSLLETQLDENDTQSMDTDGGNIGSEVDYEKNTDIWVDNGKSIVPFDDSYFVNSDSSLLETQSDENDTQSVYMQFDEIKVQDEVGKKTGESKETQCHKGNINEDLGFNFLSTGLEEIEYLIPGFEKDDTNNKRKNLSTFEVIWFPAYEQPDVARNDDGQTATATCFHRTKLKLKPDEGLYKEQKMDPSDSYKANSVDSVRSIELVNNDNIKKNGVDSKTKEYGTKTFFERKVILHKVLSEDEKKVAEFIWRASNNERHKNSGGCSIYCNSRMLVNVCYILYTLQHLPLSPATNPRLPGRLVAGDTNPGRHVARDNLKGKARQGYFPGRHSRATWPGPHSFSQTNKCHGG
ncbi:hypothetical protein Tco_0554230 [Tanacetum coccineum]